MPLPPPDRLALDASGRSIDADGHMHVASSIISAAAVNGYLGAEIPDYRELGLERDRTYQLLRDPAELARAAATFDGKPLLIIHRPQTASDHAREVVVGAISNPVWDAPNLRAELVLWDDEAIDAVEDGSQRDLSSGYRYRAVMEPGTYQGTKYDGRMTEIFGNHVALVADGRVDGAVVGDSAIPTKDTSMATQLPRAALLAASALRQYLKPRLAQDARADLPKIVAGVAAGLTKKTWKTDRPKLKLALDAAVRGKLAKDADLADVDELLDELQTAINDTADDPEPDPAQDEEAETEAEKKERLAKRAADKAAKDKAAKDAEPDKDKDTVKKPAMDAAIAAAVAKTAADTRAATIADMRAIQEAERAVRPFVGEIVIACDSAAQVYKLALDLGGIDTTGVDPSAYAAMVKMLPLPGAVVPRTPALAHDAAGATAFDKRFPGAKLLKHR